MLSLNKSKGRLTIRLKGSGYRNESNGLPSRRCSGDTARQAAANPTRAWRFSSANLTGIKPESSAFPAQKIVVLPDQTIYTGPYAHRLQPHIRPRVRTRVQLAFSVPSRRTACVLIAGAPTERFRDRNGRIRHEPTEQALSRGSIEKQEAQKFRLHESPRFHERGSSAQLFLAHGHDIQHNVFMLARALLPSNRNDDPPHRARAHRLRAVRPLCALAIPPRRLLFESPSHYRRAHAGVSRASVRASRREGSPLGAATHPSLIGLSSGNDRRNAAVAPLRARRSRLGKAPIEPRGRRDATNRSLQRVKDVPHRSILALREAGSRIR